MLSEGPGHDDSWRPWVGRVWLVVILFAAITVFRGFQVGIGPKDPGGEFLRWRITADVVLVALMALLDGGLRAGWGPDFVRRWGGALRERWTLRRIALIGAAILAYQAIYFCYHQLKSWNSFNTVHDQMLMRWDRAIFFGHTPAVVLHDLLGQHAAAYILMVIYESFTTITTLALIASLVFPERVRDSYVYIASGMWVWMLGVASYYLIPSLGPFHADPHAFSGLPHTMIQDTQTRYMAHRAHLIAHPHAADSFAQVAAFASLHIGVSSLVMLMARFYGLKRTFRALVVFVCATAVATVYLGWHFFVDDLAGLAIALVAVWIGTRMIYPHGRPEGRFWSYRIGRARRLPQ